VDMNRMLRSREEALIRREKEVAEKMSALESNRALMRQEVDSSLRREWEVKARLEIDRLVQTELEALKSQFETEVQARVDKQLAQQKAVLALSQGQSRQSSRSSADFHSSKSSSCHTASSASASADDFQLAGDVTEITVDSPAPAPPTPSTTGAALSAPTTTTALTSKRSSALLSARTPYHRAQTMFVGNIGTPMDVEMPSPSPVAIQNLSLSPRRNTATKAPGSGNIFAAANAMRNGSSARNSNDSDVQWEGRDSDDEEAMMPSPSLRNPRSIKNPFTSKNKPILQSAKSAPLSKLRAALSSASNKSAAAAAASAAATASAPTPSNNTTTNGTTDRSRSAGSRHTSPDRPDRADRRLSKIPSVASLHNINMNHAGSNIHTDSTPTLTITTSIPRRGSMDKKASNGDLVTMSAVAPNPPPLSSGWTSKVVATGKVNIRGRTLVELQQARAGGRPLSAVISGPPPSLVCPGSSSSSSGDSPSPKRAAGPINGTRSTGHDRRASSGCVIDTSVAVWDPEKEDDMPSPFLKTRQMHII
jgi:hypothetical protein